MLLYLKCIKNLSAEITYWKKELKIRKNPVTKKQIQLILSNLEKRKKFLQEQIIPFIQSQSPMLCRILYDTYMKDMTFSDAVYENVKLDKYGKEVKFKTYEAIDNFDENLEYDGDDDAPLKKVCDTYEKRLKRACRKWDMEHLSKTDSFFYL